MFTATILFFIWFVLLCRSVLAEYRYYQSVKYLEPDIWIELGSPRYLMAFISPRGNKLLKNASNPRVCELAKQHRQAGMMFISYLIVILFGASVYFKWAV